MNQEMKNQYPLTSPAQTMSSFGTPVFVLPIVRRRHSPTPIGLMPLSFSLVEQVCMRGELTCNRVEWCLSREALPGWQFCQLTFVNGCHTDHTA